MLLEGSAYGLRGPPSSFCRGLVAFGHLIGPFGLPCWWPLANQEIWHRKFSIKFCGRSDLIWLNIVESPKCVCLFFFVFLLVCLLESSWGYPQEVFLKLWNTKLDFDETLLIYKIVCLFECLYICLFIWVIFGYPQEVFLNILLRSDWIWLRFVTELMFFVCSFHCQCN